MTSPLLPLPELSRWQPLRSGLLNLYRYDREEFWFEKGRLLLRGNNGTGKSRVLALQFPFLLDGEISSRRVEPDADSAKRMEWNVLTDRHDNRTGYTWLEFGRIGDDGQPDFRSIGCGLHATRGKGAPTRWFFVTRQRIGQDLFLEGPGEVPLTRDQLRQALGDQGTVFTTARDYRRAVNEALYQLDDERYEALVELLIQLRQPQLSRQLDENKLSDALSYSLPPLDESLIQTIAESFRQLEEERVALANDQRAVESVARFLRVYSRYSAGMIAQRVADLLSAQGRYERAVKLRNAARETCATAEQELQDARQALALSRQTLSALETEKETLQARPELRDAARLSRAREDMQKAERNVRAAQSDLDKARDSLAAREQRHEQSLFAHGCAEQLLEKAYAEVCAAGKDLLGDRDIQDWRNHAADAEALRRSVSSWIHERRDALRALRELAAELERLRQAELRAQDAATRQRERWERAEEASARSRSEHERQVESHLDALGTWLDSLRILAISDRDSLEEAQSLWCDTLEGPAPLLARCHAAESNAREILADGEAASRQQLEQLLQEIAEREAERDTLLRGVDPEPAAPRFRTDAARHTRTGAPLWRLLEFQDALSSGERASVEAALEASGLLDAWLSADGRLLENANGDVLIDLAAMPAVNGDTLATLLRPDPAASGVAVALVEQVLAGIAAGPGSGTLWVGTNGRWHHGVLAGDACKDHAEYLGASARAQARLRRIAVLEAEVADARTREEALRQQQRLLAQRRNTLNEELARCPEVGGILHSAQTLQAALELAERELQERVTCDQAALQAREKVSAQRGQLALTANDLRLGMWTDRLEALPSALQACQDALNLCMKCADDVAHRKEEEQRAQEEREHAADEARRCEERNNIALETHLRLKTESDTLEASVGKGIREVQAQLEATLQRLETAREKQIQLDNSEREMDRIHYRSVSDLDNTEQSLQQQTAQRDEQRAAFLQTANTGILLEINSSEVPSENFTALSLSALVEWLRSLAKSLPEPSKDSVALDRLKRELYQSFQALAGDLSARNLHPQTEPRHGLDLVTCDYQGRSRGMRELNDLLHTETLHRQNILKAREKEFIERYLIDDIGDRLHHMILNAEELIHNMNAEMESRPMSTGLKLRLVWEAADDAPEGFREARKRLQRAKALLTPQDRATLGAFLQERIDREKRENEGGTWREHLARAVDYRRWHRFGVERHQGNGWQKLTRRTHGTGSGGEKAVALTFPQFAAAAAHYHNLPHAPRLIFLDEAFVGIDSDMRGKCMGLLEHFDLDFVMTSEREWGCYASIRGLAICQLSAMQGSDVVAISRWIWNGHAMEESPSPEPARPSIESAAPQDELFT